MSATPGLAQGSLWKVWPAPAALLTGVLLLLYVGNNRAADPETAPTPEEQARYLEWYKQQAAQKAAQGTDSTPTREDVQRLREWYNHNGAPQPISTATDTRTGPAPEEVARFIDWYKHEGAPRPSGTAPPPPTSDDVVRFLAWYRRNGKPTPHGAPTLEERPPNHELVARYLEAYHHSVASAPHTPLPVVVALDAQPVSEEVARFVEWYRREGAPRPTGTAAPQPTRDDVVSFLAWYRRNGAPTATNAQPVTTNEVACYLEAYRHSGAPTPHAPQPVVVPIDVQPMPSAVADTRPAPMSDEVVRFVDWYKHEGAPRPSGTAPPPPTPDDVVRFLAWYHRNGAPTPIHGTDTDEQHLTNDEVARFLDAYHHNGAPTPHAAPVSVVTRVDLKPVPTAATPSEDVARFVDWYKHEGAPRPSGAAPPPPTPDDVVRFLAWYRRNGAPTPSRETATEEQHLTKDEIARYLDAYHHSGVPTPHPLPVVTKVDVQPGYDPNVQPVVAQEPAPPVLIVQAPQLAEVQPPSTNPRSSNDGSSEGAPPPTEVRPPSSNLIPVPPPPPLQMAPSPAPPTVVATAPAPLPPALAELPPAPMVALPAKPPTVPVMPTPSPTALPAKPPTVPVTPTAPVEVAEPPVLTPFDAILQQVGCSSCGTGGGLLSAHGPSDNGPPSSAASPGCNCGSGGCVPGRLHQCSPCEADTAVGRFLCGVYQCICCPDPCYDPHWIPIADAAFFTESARPQTQQSIGWDAGRNFTNPDRAEYFWARADGKGAGPNPANHGNPNGLLGESSVNYNDLWLYTEAALGNIGTFVYMPYRSLDGELVGHAAGFSDMQVGTKTLLFDCELLQIAFEFRTFIPIGNATKGLGTGHVSLEPGVIVGLKVGPETYFQGQVEEWIPLGGDTDYEGALLEYHMSVNQVLCRILPDVPLVGTAEMSGWSFQHGLFTDPVLGPGQRASGGTYIAIGPGLRLFVCDKIDFGIGTAFAVTDRHFADQLFRTEFRWRF